MYRNRRLVVKPMGKSPVFLGPCMSHFKTDGEAITRFALEMYAGNPKVIELKAAGVETESANYQRFKSNFQDLSRFVCVSHLQQRDERNIEKFLERTNKTSAIKKKSKYEILKDFFDEEIGTYYEYGLVESLDTDDFQAELASLQEKWKTTIPGVHEWFLKHQKVYLEESMIQSVRVSSNVEGLYYQNDIDLSTWLSFLIATHVQFALTCFDIDGSFTFTYFIVKI